MPAAGSEPQEDQKTQDAEYPGNRPAEKFHDGIDTRRGEMVQGQEEFFIEINQVFSHRLINMEHLPYQIFQFVEIGVRE